MSRGAAAAPEIAIIAAVADNAVIGRDNDLPWRLSEDLRRFKALTLGHPVIMGRRTFESMGRPLPERRNIVLSGTPGYRSPGIEVYGSLDEALAAIGGGLVFILGGQRLFAEALPRADRLYLTRVRAHVQGDVTFPDFDPAEWRLTATDEHPADDRNEYDCTFETYERGRED